MSPRLRGGPPQLGLFGEAPPDAPPPAAEATRQLADALPETLRLGTSSWTFPGWQGLVWREPLSERVLAREGLALYARHPLFRTVGIDRSFYAPVEAAVFRSYAAQVPEGFRFLVKAHEACTTPRWPLHARYGARRGETNERFLDAGWATDQVVAPVVEGLGPKAGPILFQLPPQPAAELGGADAFADRLHAFLEALPRGPLYAVELRTGALLAPRYLQALADVGAVHCCNVYPGMMPLARQLERHDPLAGPAVVVRWMLHAGQSYETAVARYRPFSALVDEDPETRAVVAKLALAAAARRLPAWFIVNNKAEGSAPLSIERLAAAIADLQKSGQR